MYTTIVVVRIIFFVVVANKHHRSSLYVHLNGYKMHKAVDTINVTLVVVADFL